MACTGVATSFEQKLGSVAAKVDGFERTKITSGHGAQGLYAKEAAIQKELSALMSSTKDKRQKRQIAAQQRRLSNATVDVLARWIES